VVVDVEGGTTDQDGWSYRHSFSRNEHLYCSQPSTKMLVRRRSVQYIAYGCYHLFMLINIIRSPMCGMNDGRRVVRTMAREDVKNQIMTMVEKGFPRDGVINVSDQ